MGNNSLLKALFVFAIAAILPANLYAAQIGQGDFVNPTVLNYNNLGLPHYSTTPIIIGGHTHTLDDGQLFYYAFPSYGMTGESIANNTDTGFIDIVLDTPVLMAGGMVGASTGYVEFFDDDNNLLGTVPVSSTPAFAGWDSEGGNIRRIRINDTQSNGLILLFDDLTTEGQGNIEPKPTSIPTLNEWGIIILMGLAGLASVYHLRRQNSL